MKKTKNLIIGFGKAGKTLAKTLATKYNEDVILVEKSDVMYGGTCINIGCLPTKRLIHDSKSTSYPQAIEEKDDMVLNFRKANFDMLDKLDKLTVLTGTASFLDNHTVLVESKNKPSETILAERIFINTGAKSFISKEIAAFNSQNIYDSKKILSLKQLPKNLLIIGSGYIGLEFANMFNNFGSTVYVTDHHPDILPREDADVKDEIKADLTSAGINFLLNSKIQKIEDLADQTSRVIYIENDTQTEKEIIVDAVLVATGRVADISDLKLENTDLTLTDKGFIQVDKTLKTNLNHIWAIGDVNGGPQFTYISLDDFRIIENQLFADKSYDLSKRGLFPSTLFIDPQYSRIGLNEKEAQKQNISYRVLKMPVAKIPAAKVLRQSKGLLKILVNEQDEILGAMIYALNANEIINLFSILISEL